MDDKTTIHELKERVRKFCEERDWDQYHNAKDLVIGIVTEASELLDHFRFKNENDVRDMLNNPQKRLEVSEELSDTLYFVLRLAKKYNIDLSTTLAAKMEKTAKKYPLDKAKGSNKKYTEL